MVLQPHHYYLLLDNKPKRKSFTHFLSTISVFIIEWLSVIFYNLIEIAFKFKVFKFLKFVVLSFFIEIGIIYISAFQSKVRIIFTYEMLLFFSISINSFLFITFILIVVEGISESNRGLKLTIAYEHHYSKYPTATIVALIKYSTCTTVYLRYQDFVTGIQTFVHLHPFKSNCQLSLHHMPCKKTQYSHYYQQLIVSHPYYHGANMNNMWNDVHIKICTLGLPSPRIGSYPTSVSSISESNQ